MRIFDFEKVDGKWKVKLNAKTAAYFYMTHGIPLETYTDMANELSLRQKITKAVADWNSYRAENKI